MPPLRRFCSVVPGIVLFTYFLAPPKKCGGFALHLLQRSYGVESLGEGLSRDESPHFWRRAVAWYALEYPLGVEKNRHRALIDQLDLHLGAELTVCHFNAQRFQAVTGRFVEDASLLSLRRRDERRSAAAPRIAV